VNTIRGHRGIPYYQDGLFNRSSKYVITNRPEFDQVEPSARGSIYK